MNVGDLLSRLSELPADSILYIDRSPVTLRASGLDSYRGYYEDLAIGAETDGYTVELRTVGDFRKALHEKVGKTIRGYKGGEYTVTPRTRVWISNRGECSGALVTGVRHEDHGFAYLMWTNDDD